MLLEMLKAKIHRVKITGADLNYVGSITIDRSLLKAAGILPGEKVSVVNVNNGERLDTYVIEGAENTGEVTMNGPAARRVQKGDIVIIIAYALMEEKEAGTYQPRVIFPDEESNRLK